MLDGLTKWLGIGQVTSDKGLRYVEGHNRQC